jgi:hypothetical protein
MRFPWVRRQACSSAAGIFFLKACPLCPDFLRAGSDESRLQARCRSTVCHDELTPSSSVVSLLTSLRSA